VPVAGGLTQICVCAYRQVCECMCGSTYVGGVPVAGGLTQVCVCVQAGVCVHVCEYMCECMCVSTCICVVHVQTANW